MNTQPTSSGKAFVLIGVITQIIKQGETIPWGKKPASNKAVKGNKLVRNSTKNNDATKIYSRDESDIFLETYVPVEYTQS